MAGSLAGTSNYLQNKLIDFELRAQAFTPPATVYVALLTCSKGPIARSILYALNDTASFIAGDGNNHLYKCTTGGTTAGSAPSYPGVIGEAITDGTAVFTEQTVAIQANTAGIVVEPSGNAYARVAVAASLTNWAGTQGAGTTAVSSGTSATTSNNITVQFPTPTGTWTASPIQVWGFATFDASTVGNLLRYGGLSADQVINTGNNVSFAAGALTISNDQ